MTQFGFSTYIHQIVHPKIVVFKKPSNGHNDDAVFQNNDTRQCFGKNMLWQKLWQKELIVLHIIHSIDSVQNDQSWPIYIDGSIYVSKQMFLFFKSG